MIDFGKVHRIDAGCQTDSEPPRVRNPELRILEQDIAQGFSFRMFKKRKIQKVSAQRHFSIRALGKRGICVWRQQARHGIGKLAVDLQGAQQFRFAFEPFFVLKAGCAILRKTRFC